MFPSEQQKQSRDKIKRLKTPNQNADDSKLGVKGFVEVGAKLHITMQNQIRKVPDKIAL